VARRPNQSPKDENIMAFQSFLKAGIDITLSRTAEEELMGLGTKLSIG
jgi:hypothetical protein